MEWLTKIDLGEFESHKEALDESLNRIKEWCELNNFKFELSHNTYYGGIGKENTNFNRVIHISDGKYHNYSYKLIVTYFFKQIGSREVEINTMFGKRIETQGIYDINKTWYGRLQRIA